MGEFRESFESYGADYDTTISRFMNSEQSYLRFLDMLFEDENLRKLGEALDVGAFAEAFEAAHTLKGVAGNMGLTPLYQAVCAIVEPLRAGKDDVDYRELYHAIRAEFERVDEFRTSLKGGTGK